jgi:glycosidase
MPALPQLQVAKNPEVASYIFQVEEYWLKKGIDGWRLDVPNEIDSDAFWREFRKRAKQLKPNAYIVGEIWDPAQRWLQGDQFDSVMNYQWRNALVKTFAKREAKVEDLDAALKKLRGEYHPAITHAMFNVLGSHDTERFLTLAGGDAGRLKLAVACQMTQPGPPVIYYGDEVGMQGAKDPDNRRAFDWRSDRWNRDVLGTYQKLIAARKAHVSLRLGTYRTLWTQDEVYAYGRGSKNEDAIVVLNNGTIVRDLSLPVTGWLKDGTRLSDVLGGRPAVVRKGKVWLRMDPSQAAVFVPGSALAVPTKPREQKPKTRRRRGTIL